MKKEIKEFYELVNWMNVLYGIIFIIALPVIIPIGILVAIIAMLENLGESTIGRKNQPPNRDNKQ